MCRSRRCPTDRLNIGRLGLNDIRQLKRVLDQRFGTFSRLVQFCMVGASGMVVDLSFYALFQMLFARIWPGLDESFGQSVLLAACVSAGRWQSSSPWSGTSPSTGGSRSTTRAAVRSSDSS